MVELDNVNLKNFLRSPAENQEMSLWIRHVHVVLDAEDGTQDEDGHSSEDDRQPRNSTAGRHPVSLALSNARHFISAVFFSRLSFSRLDRAFTFGMHTHTLCLSLSPRYIGCVVCKHAHTYLCVIQIAFLSLSLS